MFNLPALWAFLTVTVAGCNGPVLLVVKPSQLEHSSFPSGPRLCCRPAGRVLGLSLYTPPERCNKSFFFQCDSMGRIPQPRAAQPVAGRTKGFVHFFFGRGFAAGPRAESSDSAFIFHPKGVTRAFPSNVIAWRESRDRAQLHLQPNPLQYC
jgi:hypothetical protein